MANANVLKRLEGIRKILVNVHEMSAPMSSATKGEERAAFIGQFLEKVMPTIYRFGSGEVTDVSGRISGQLDVVVEYPFVPSLPTLGAGQTRLYLAEGVAAVIEVKSDVAGQWDEAVKTAKALREVQRNYQTASGVGPLPSNTIPFFVAGYTGWKTGDTIRERLADGPVDGVLVIDPGLFVSTQAFGVRLAEGPCALWGLISSIHRAISRLESAYVDPLKYLA